MPDNVNGKAVFTLLEVTKSIQKTLAERYTSAFWVKAEMNKLNFYPHTGHCYPELVEKTEGKIIAQIKSTLWRDDYITINNAFLNILKEPLKDGIKILFLARISFDPAYGLALRILDIDPSYTLGDLEREKQETINRLKEEGIFNRNKLLELPLLPQRIAIISVESSKGYADFLKVIENNPWNYKFFHFLFPSLLQGEKAVRSISAQLRRIKKVRKHFDVVAIIRGGGGDVGLSCYNDYNLSKAIARFPIPVITGIGHATNETVAEMISFSNAITPTKLAEFLLQEFHNFSVPVQDAENTIADKALRLISDERNILRAEVKLFRSVTESVLVANRNELKGLSKSVIQQARFIFRNENEFLRSARVGISKAAIIFCSSAKLELKQFGIAIKKDSLAKINRFKLIAWQAAEKLTVLASGVLKSTAVELSNTERNLRNMSPESVLKRGYSITLLNGRSIKSSSQVKAKDSIETILNTGRISSIVQSTDNTKDNG